MGVFTKACVWRSIFKVQMGQLAPKSILNTMDFKENDLANSLTTGLITSL